MALAPYQTKMKKPKWMLSAVLIIASLLLSTVPVGAANEVKLYLSPSEGTINSGSILTLNLMEDSGNASINAVSTHITFSGSSLQFMSVEPSDKLGFSGDNFKDGVINIIQGTNKPISGNQLVATISFKVTGGSGNANVVVDPVISDDNSSVINYDSHKNILTTVSSGSYSLSVGSPQSGASSPQSSTSPSQSAAPSSLNKSQSLSPVTDTKKVSPGLVNSSGVGGVGSDDVAVDQPTESKRRLDNVILLSLVPVLIVTGVLSRAINRRYGKGKSFISRVRRRRVSSSKDSVADIESRINMTHPDTKHETIAEIAARINRKASGESETVAELAARLRAKAKRKTAGHRKRH